MHRSRLKCYRERNLLTSRLENKLSTSSSNSSKWKQMFKIKWSTEKNWDKKLTRSIRMRENKSTPSSTRWLMKIMKCLESIKWSKSNLNKTWSFHSMRRKHFWNVKRNLMNMKKNWSEDTLLSNKNVQVLFKPWKTKLRLNVKLSSRNLPWRKLNVGLERSMKRT